MSNSDHPHRASRFIEDMPDPLQPQSASSDLLYSILSQMDEFEQKREHRSSHSSAESWGSSGTGQEGSSKGSTGWLKSVKGLGIKGKLRGLVKTNGTEALASRGRRAATRTVEHHQRASTKTRAASQGRVKNAMRVRGLEIQCHGYTNMTIDGRWPITKV